MSSPAISPLLRRMLWPATVGALFLTATPLFSVPPDSQKKTAKAKPAVAMDAELAIKKFQLAEGLEAGLFAAEPMLQNPVCFSFDEKGRLYVVETHRMGPAVVDIRKHMGWLDEELASMTLADHFALIERHRSEIPKVLEGAEKISWCEDTDGDGKADRSGMFDDSFNGIADGVAAGVLVRKGDVYFTCMPSLFLLKDKDGDGKSDEKKALQTGYGVRFAYIGHDLHGLRIGPDGKLYFSAGDRGFHIEQNGKTISSPEAGAVLRCDLDGSNLEIFAYGLRNPQELVFDDYGNLFTGENNSDGGDQARWTYVVEGATAGWHIGWQYQNHPVSRSMWNLEGMWDPKRAPDVGYITPPIANLGNGPSGLTYYPGQGLPDSYRNHFFLADFKGSSARSVVHSFINKPKGAGFELAERADFISNVLVTDVEFGPDGAFYLSDWTEGWECPNKGRIYRFTHPATATNAVVAAKLAEAQKLIAEDLSLRSVKALVPLLAHADQRVRQEAQFALAGKGKAALSAFAQTAKNSPYQLARIHAIWGLGQLAKTEKDKALQPLVPLLSDWDPEIRVQAAKVLGDAHYAPAYKSLLKMLANPVQPRGQFFAVQALGKLKNPAAVPSLLWLLQANDDKDAFLRHAGVMALVTIGDKAAIITAAKHTSPAVRHAACIAMRRLEMPEIAECLGDRESVVVQEAARAINDLPISQVLPALANRIEGTYTNEALVRRILNANFRVGFPKNAEALARYAVRKDAPAALRAEALSLLGEWKKPSNRDLITGLWRPLSERDDKPALEAVKPSLVELLKDDAVEVKLAAVALATQWEIEAGGPALYALVKDAKVDAKVRVQSLKALAKVKSAQLKEAVQEAAKDANEELRKEAVALLAKLTPAGSDSPLIQVLAAGTMGEKQNAISTLGTLTDDGSAQTLNEWMDKLLAGKLPPEMQLELLTAAAQRATPELKAKLETFEAARTKDDLGPYRECLSGGNAAEGKKIFFERVEASCNRCHKIDGEGGEVGPVLDGIGTRKDREYMLKSILNPNAEIAAGFESVIVTLKNGTSAAGTLKSENDADLVINSPEDGLVTVKKADIVKRDRGLSGMPPELGKILSKQDLRNLMEYLASHK